MWNLPKAERQVNGFDSNACGIYAVNNCIESWFIKLNLPEYRDYNISDRFVSINVGGLQGNLPADVVDSIRENGFVKEELMPFGGVNKEDYYDKTYLTPELILEGRKILDIFDISYEWVKFTYGKEQAIRDALKEAPLVGVIFNPDGTTHAVMIHDEQEYFDSAEPFVKKLDLNKLHYALKIFVKVKDKKPTATIYRYEDTGKQTLGRLSASNGNAMFNCDTLELTWKGNQRNVSAIPPGKYNCKWTFSPKFMKYTYEVMKVPNRSGIRIHAILGYKNLSGCVGLGMGLADINKDKQMDLLRSRNIVDSFNRFMNKKDFTLTII